MIWLFRFFVVSPMAVIYFVHETHHGMLRERVSEWNWFGATLACLGVIWAWDLARKPPRTLPSVIITRMLLTSMVAFSFIGLLMGNWYVWYILSHSVVWLIIWLQLGVHRFAHHFVYPNDPSGSYFEVRRAGWHPFFDRLPRLFNPDPELIRIGGKQEPRYSGFVPPRNWTFQCPECHSRVQFEIDVCWNCGYGARGS
ncbi:MAG: hypothetical protein CMM00_16305 [Rhodopirellula sp.]|nr:hypothetical protein [Rhodopirellula sp.]